MKNITKWVVWALVLAVGAVVAFLIRESGFEYTWGVLIGAILCKVVQWIVYKEVRRDVDE